MFVLYLPLRLFLCLPLCLPLLSTSVVYLCCLPLLSTSVPTSVVYNYGHVRVCIKICASISINICIKSRESSPNCKDLSLFGLMEMHPGRPSIPLAPVIHAVQLSHRTCIFHIDTGLPALDATSPDFRKI